MREALTTLASTEPSEPVVRLVAPTQLHAHAHTRSNEVEIGQRLRCVSSGYMSDGCSCRASIPASVVADAWARELKLAGSHEDGFFHFAWRGGVWLAYGLGDGSVRGVYCPSHSAQRAVRSFTHSVSVAC